ncbi:uncharacterized protein LOC134290849 [Aedes albopictus]|uniref:CCHC-type domain-containing protein n=1 Tax=Aedes albopictus TaxID=7160 RepID=A0ABM1Y9M3_AEDAL
MSYVLNPNIEPFRKGQSFSTWIKRLGYHFRVNKVNDDQKKDQMFLLGGDYLFSMADKLYPTEEMLDGVSYEILVQKLKEKVDKTDSILLQRHHFSMKVQQHGETASNFIFSLKALAEYCEFGDQKNRLIVDRILVGLTDNSLRHRLLTEDSSKLTLAQVENIIASWKMANIHTKVLKNNDNYDLVASIYNRYASSNGRQFAERKVRTSPKGFRGSMNSRFGFQSAEDRYNVTRSRFQHPRHRHPPAGTIHRRRRMDDTRWAMEQPICDYCGRRGHQRRQCYILRDNLSDEEVSYIPEAVTDDTNGLSEEVDRLMTIDCGSDGSDSGELECMHVSSIEKSDPCLLNISIEDNPVQMEVDSGSSVTVMDKNSFNSKFDIPLSKSLKQLVVVNGSRLKVSGEVEVKVEHNDKIANLHLLVIDCDYQFIPLLGRPWLDEFCPNWRNFFGDLMPVNNILKNQSKTLVADTNSNFKDIVVKNSTKTVKHFESDLILIREVPIFEQFYDVPFYFREIIFKCDNRLNTEKSIITIETKPQATANILDKVKQPCISTLDLLNAVQALNNSAALMGNADVCLRFRSIVSLPTKYDRELQKIFMFENNLPVSFLDIANQTKRYTFLSKLSNFLHHGWYADIEQFVVACGLCATVAILPKLNIRTKSKPAETPFSKKHTIHFRFKHNAFLLLVNSFSKWVEVNSMRKILLKLADCFGLPDLLSDKGLSFNTLSKFITKEIQSINVTNKHYNPADTGQEKLRPMTFYFKQEIVKLCVRDRITLKILTLKVEFPSENVLGCLVLMVTNMVNQNRNYQLMLILLFLLFLKANQYYTDDITFMVWSKQNIPHLQEQWVIFCFSMRISENLLQILVDTKTRSTAHSTRIRIVEDGREPELSTRSIRVVETGRSMPAIAEPDSGTVDGDDIRQIPDQSDIEGRRKSYILIEHRNVKRKAQSESVVLTGLPRRSRRTRKTMRQKVRIFLCFLLNYCSSFCKREELMCTM